MTSKSEKIQEQQRLRALLQYQILDTLPEQAYDDYTTLAATICETPVSLITFLDDKRQWFKSRVGFDKPETPREQAFCHHAIETPLEPMVVHDAADDERFVHNPLVTGSAQIRFYAGVPLVNPEGHALGTLCVIDHKPRSINAQQLDALKVLARQLIQQLEWRKRHQQMKASLKLLKDRNKSLEAFARMAAHDLKSPLNNMSSLNEMLENEHAGNLDDNGKQLLQMIGVSTKKLKRLVEGILQYSRNTSALEQARDKVSIAKTWESVVQLFSHQTDVQFMNEMKDDVSLVTNEVALSQIILNLVSNSIKHNNRKNAEVRITAESNPNYVKIHISDNGPGIPQADRKRIFELFSTLKEMDETAAESNTGIGLATVKSLTEGLGGEVDVTSEEGKGSTFTITLPRQ